MTASLSDIRDKVALYKGSRIRYRTSKGRRKVEENQGVIVETYPNIFTLWVESQ
ncbi:MAG TPA: Veg family protein, partial [Synergistales bacterium]|nr:Veg family protein [Synergistales bacterium]